jgi:hypothetical protein
MIAKVRRSWPLAVWVMMSIFMAWPIADMARESEFQSGGAMSLFANKKGGIIEQRGKSIASF